MFASLSPARSMNGGTATAKITSTDNSRADVVNVDGKGGAGLRQVGVKETNGSEPLMTCRNVLEGVETGTRTSVPRIEIEGNLSTAQSASGMKAA
jgi:hypothetical protein